MTDNVPFNITYDTETTGLYNRKQLHNDERQAWPVQLGFISTDDNWNTVQEYDKIVCPPPGAIFHPRAVAVHGITEERARDEGIPMKQAIDEFAHACFTVGDGLRTAYNIAFDDNIMLCALARTYPELRVDMEVVTVDGKEVRTYSGPGIDFIYGKTSGMCIMDMATGYCRVSAGNGAFRRIKLEQAYRRITGYNMQGAHDALADVKGALTIFEIMLDTTRPLA